MEHQKKLQEETAAICKTIAEKLGKLTLESRKMKGGPKTAWMH